MSSGAQLSFQIIHADDSRTALCGLPVAAPVTICFAADAASQSLADELTLAVIQFLLGLGTHVQPCPPVCQHGAAGIATCAECNRHESIALLVVLTTSSTINIADLAWWTSDNDRRRVLPVFKRDSHPENFLPDALKKYNAAFWTTTPAELAATVLSAAGITPESHRIFISYRRLETEPLAEDLFETLNRLGFNVFLDRFAVPPAVNFQRRLHHDLAEKAMVLLLESDRFGESPWTVEEITYCKRYELGLYSLRMPWGLAGKDTETRKVAGVLPEWRTDLKRDCFESDPRNVPFNNEAFLEWGRLTEEARERIGGEIRKRHDAAMLRRRENMRTQMLKEIADRGATPAAPGTAPLGPEYRERADGLIFVTSQTATNYAIWLTPRPPELPDFHATHAGCQFPPKTVGVIVGLKSLLEPEAQRRLKWLSGVCRLVLVDQGHIVSAARKIVAGAL